MLLSDGHSLVAGAKSSQVEWSDNTLYWEGANANGGQTKAALGSGADLLFTLRREAFEGFVASHDAGTYRGRLRVKKAEAVEDAAALRVGDLRRVALGRGAVQPGIGAAHGNILRMVRRHQRGRDGLRFTARQSRHEL